MICRIVITAGYNGKGEIMFSSSDLPGKNIVTVSILTPDGKLIHFIRKIV